MSEGGGKRGKAVSKRMSLFVVCLATAVATSAARAVRKIAFSWPSVQPLRTRYYFPKSFNARIALTIRSVEGKPLYSLNCEPDYTRPDGTIEAFQCRLNRWSATHQRDYTLLGDDPLDRLEAHSRGLVWASQVHGNCASYPGWGAVRAFRLRGMRLTLRFVRVAVVDVMDAAYGPGGPHKVKAVAFRSFGVRVSVDQDPASLGAVAEPLPYAPPTLVCGPPERVHVPGLVDEAYIESNNLGPPYPGVAAIKESVTIRGEPVPTDFGFDAARVPPKDRVVDLAIPGTDAKPAYQLECSAYNVPIGGGRIDRYGIVCGLFQAGGDVNLLANAVDPYSRMNPSEILPEQLYGGCAGYPEWGAEREFALRGMRLTMLFSQPVFTTGDFAPHALRSVRLTLRVEPDVSAISPVAPPPQVYLLGRVGSRGRVRDRA